MTNKIQETLSIWKIYDFLKENCSRVELQGVPYSFIWRAYGNNIPDEVPIRVWDSEIDRSLIGKLRKQIPFAFDERGMILENALRDLIVGIPLSKSADNEVCFRKNLAKLCGYDYHPQREESADDCGETYWYNIPAKFEKIKEINNE